MDVNLQVGVLNEMVLSQRNQVLAQADQLISADEQECTAITPLST